MTSTKFGTYCLDETFNNNLKNEYDDNFKLLFILATSFFIYNLSSIFFKKNDNTIKPLECSFKYLFTYDNSFDDSDSLDESDNSDDNDDSDKSDNSDSSDDNDDNSSDSDENDHNNSDSLEQNNLKEEYIEEHVDDDNNDSDVKEVDVEEYVDDNNNDSDVKEVDVDDNNNYSEYSELFQDQEFKVFLLKFLKEKELNNTEKINKYNNLIKNLERDILEYVYVEDKN